MIRKYCFFIFLFSGIVNLINAQVVINEASNRNYTQIYDEDGDNEDWIELYNNDIVSINLKGWYLSDDLSVLDKWMFPSISINPGSFSLIYASGKNRKGDINHWECAVLPSDSFYYTVPNVSTPNDWNSNPLIFTSWEKGIAGFGYEDGDDSTIVNNTSMAIYIVKKFSIPDTSVISKAIAYIDYDDGFVAYLNGVEICRNNITGVPAWDNNASGNHEAQIYSGGAPEKYTLDMTLIESIWIQGENTFAIEVHNNSSTSSDVSLIPFLTFAIKDSSTNFSPLPVIINENIASGIHTNFKISSTGETIYLSNSEKQLVDSLPVKQLEVDFSVGRVTDGGSIYGLFTQSTPGKSNNTSTANTKGYEPSPEFTVQSGFYNTSIKVGITNLSPGSTIRYTLDGSEPTGTSTVYSGTNIIISATKTLKACCFSNTGKLPGKAKTANYFIKNEYTVPVLSITTNNENLFGGTGICDNWGQDWVKPCYIEYYDKNKVKSFEQAASIQIDGGAGGSRSQNQHSFRIEPGNGALGDGDLNYKLIPDRYNRTEYASFYLRNGSNQYLVLPYKDALEVKAMGKGTNNYYSAYTPIVVYVNAEYWGLYELREKINVDYFEKNYGANPDSTDILGLSYYTGQTLRAIKGSTDHFWNDYNNFLNLTISDSDYLKKADQIIDLKYYTDYIIAQSWICNSDWPNNNIKIIRSNITNYRWRFALLDLEWSLDPNGWTQYTTDHINYMRYCSPEIPYVRFWQELIKNTDYKNAFINRFADLMNTNYLYSNLLPMEEEMFNAAYPEMAAEYNKWTLNPRPVDEFMDIYKQNHELMKQSLRLRSAQVRNHIQNNFGLTRQLNVELDVSPVNSGKIKISTITPDSYPWNGIYFDGVPVTITAIPNPGYKFKNWDNNGLITELTNPVFSKNINLSNKVFKANFETNTLPFGAVTISEVNYKDEPSIATSDWIELYNYGTAPLSLKGYTLRDDNPKHCFYFPDSCIIGENCRIIITRDTLMFKSMHPDLMNVVGLLGFGLGSSENNIQLYNEKDSLVVSVHYLDSIPWPVGADGRGLTMELVNPYQSLNDPNNWFNSCIGGSPGLPYTPCDEPVVISEICNNPPPDPYMADYIELWNTSAESVDISGWILKDKVDTHKYVIPSPTIIEPGKRLVVAQSPDLLNRVHPLVTSVCGVYQFGFSEKSDWVRFYDSNEKLRLSVKYDVKAPWPAYSVGNYFTLELLDPTADVNNGSNWFAGCYSGSPEKKYVASECKTAIDEISYNTINIYPNPASDYINIDIQSIGFNGKYSIKLYTIIGTEVLSEVCINNGSEVKKQINLQNIPKGILILLMKSGSIEKRVTFIHK
jgi:hypothetical protein